MPRAHREGPPRAHEPRAGVDGQLLLQLSHAVHDVGVAEGAPEPSDQQPQRGRERANGPAKRVQRMSSRQDAGVDGGQAPGVVRVASAPLPVDEQSIAASLLWSIRGDAGQRALMAWMMGWKPAQDASGTQWLPPYLAGLLDIRTTLSDWSPTVRRGRSPASRTFVETSLRRPRPANGTSRKSSGRGVTSTPPAAGAPTPSFSSIRIIKRVLRAFERRFLRTGRTRSSRLKGEPGWLLKANA